MTETASAGPTHGLRMPAEGEEGEGGARRTFFHATRNSARGVVPVRLENKMTPRGTRGSPGRPCVGDGERKKEGVQKRLFHEKKRGENTEFVKIAPQKKKGRRLGDPNTDKKGEG